MSCRPDLFDEHTAERFDLAPDAWGTPSATLVELSGGGDCALLYLHGYNDYHHCAEMGLRFRAMGFRFFALDLRDHGRSIRPGRPIAFATDLSTYYEEIGKALRTIRRRGCRTVALLGHSTGALTAALFAADVGGIDALVLNSPFFAFKATGAVAWALRNLWPTVGRAQPMRRLPVEPDPRYAWSLHSGFERGGEWTYDLAWKLPGDLPVRAGWVGAVARGHARVRGGLTIRCPVLCLTSARRGGDADGFGDEWFTSDTVLDPAACVAGARAIEGYVTTTRIDGAVHDLVLSRGPVRDAVYRSIGAWLAWL